MCTQIPADRSFIAALFVIAKTWKQPRCPLVGEWINKLWNIQTMECYTALKRNELFTCKKVKCILLREKPNLKRLPTVWFQLHDILEKAKYYGDNINISGWQELGRRKGRIGRAQRIWKGSKNTLYDTLNHGYMSLYICPNPMNVTKPRMNPNVNYGLRWLWCVDVGSSVVPLWWRTVIIGESMYVSWQEVHGKSLYLPLNFAVNLKLL